MYKLIKTQGTARRGEFHTVHGVVQTPAFMNVATAAAIKGGLSAKDLEDIRCQVMLSNTYHLHLRPTDKLVRQMGGLHQFTTWKRPILTDSGGFQVFSLSALRKIKEEGVYFASHLDGHKIFMGPEQSMQIQSNLGSTIAMAFDECVENPAEYSYSKQSCERTVRWLARCKAEMQRLNSLDDTVNKNQLLFGINQGCCFDDLRYGSYGNRNNNTCKNKTCRYRIYICVHICYTVYNDRRKPAGDVTLCRQEKINGRVHYIKPYNLFNKVWL